MEIPQASFKEILSAEKPLLLDVRTKEEYNQCHLEGFHLLPLQDFSIKKVEELLQGEKRPIYLLCRSGGRSAQAAEILLKAGFKEVFNIQGGLLGYLPERDKLKMRKRFK